MIQRIKINDIKIGMFVIIPGSWLKHNFLRNAFLINSDDQLTKLRESGFDDIDVDSSRSQSAVDVESITHPAPEKALPEKWEEKNCVPSGFSEAINDVGISPDVKARVVYHYSRQMMENLFSNPTASFIGEGKQAIAQLADLILNEDDTASSLLKITSHDFYTYSHSVNVGILGIYLAKQLYKSGSGHDIHELGSGFFLHDLGKVKIDPDIINKPGRLTDEEMNVMRSHPYQSYKVLEESTHLTEESRIIAMQHHEREDGTGYPRRLKGDEIHDYARICCVVDVYDALTAERSYKKALSPYQALRVMKEQLLGHFQPDIFEAFVRILS